MPNVLINPLSSIIEFNDAAAGDSTLDTSLTGASRLTFTDGELNVKSFSPSEGRFSVDGSSGRLFTVSDSLTGTVFSVNDISGLPILQVDSNADDVVTMGSFGTNALVVRNSDVGIGTDQPNEKLTVVGNISATGSLSVGNVSQTLSNLSAASAVHTHDAATTSIDGFMSSSDKTKLDGIAAGAQVNVATNLGITAGNTAGPIVTSSTGTNATLPTATGSNSGVITTGAQTIAGAKTFTSQVSAVSLNVFGKIIGGSATNTAAGADAAVLGGRNNTAGGLSSNVAGGDSNTACGNYSNVAGGVGNTACGGCSNVAGGDSNTASGDCANVAGGALNKACGGSSTVAGGYKNTASENYDSVLGGYCNTASGGYSSIGGGRCNITQGPYSSVTGGSYNTARGNNSHVGGGLDNKACADQSSILGGTTNTILSAHTNSFIVGSNITSSAACYTFVNNLSSQCIVTASTLLARGNLGITGTTKESGRFYAGTTSPTNTTRLNYDGELRALRFGAGGNLGLSDTITFVDGTGLTHTVYINGGIITEWGIS